MTQPTARRRTHLPRLNPSQLSVVFGEIDKLGINDAGKRQLKAMLQAAANPQNETPETVIPTLAPERQQQITTTQQAVGGLLNGVVARGAAKLAQIDDAEWERLTRGG